MTVSWDDHTDVVIVGSGAAGLSAAIETRQASDAIDWTRSLGVRYTGRLDQFGGHSVPRTVTIEHNAGHAIVKALKYRLDQLDVSIPTVSFLPVSWWTRPPAVESSMNGRTADTEVRPFFPPVIPASASLNRLNQRKTDGPDIFDPA